MLELGRLTPSRSLAHHRFRVVKIARHGNILFALRAGEASR